MAEKLRAAGGKVTEHYYEERGHIALVTSLATPLRDRALALDDVTVFLQASD